VNHDPQHFYEIGLAKELWHILAAVPVSDELRFGFFRDAIAPEYGVFFSPETRAMLLRDCIAALPCEQMSKSAWDCFMLYFIGVSELLKKAQAKQST
jgi:hypothetical protein